MPKRMSQGNDTTSNRKLLGNEGGGVHSLKAGTVKVRASPENSQKGAMVESKRKTGDERWKGGGKRQRQTVERAEKKRAGEEKTAHSMM